MSNKLCYCHETFPLLVAGVQDGFLTVDGGGSLLSDVAPGSALTLSFSIVSTLTCQKHNNQHGSSPLLFQVCWRPNLCWAPSSRKVAARLREWVTGEKKFICWPTELYLLSWQRWCPSVSTRQKQTASWLTPDRSVTWTPGGTEETQTSRRTTATTAASDTLRGWDTVSQICLLWRYDTLWTYQHHILLFQETLNASTIYSKTVYYIVLIQWKIHKCF